MNFPPLLLLIHVRDKTQKFRLFLPIPIFLLALLIIVLLPVLLFVSVILLFLGWGILGFRLIAWLWNLLCAVRGTHIEVKGKKEEVKIIFI